MKSRYLVLSDDRVLPPYQGNRPKSVPPQFAQTAQQANLSQLIPGQTSVAQPNQMDISRPPPQFLSGLPQFVVQQGGPPQYVVQPGVSGVMPIQMPIQMPLPLVIPSQIPMPGATAPAPAPSADPARPPSAPPNTMVVTQPQQQPTGPAPAANTSLPFLPVKQKRKRKTAQSGQTTSKRSTPMRKAKEDQRSRPAATSTEQEFVSCSSESDEEMVTDQVPV